MKKQDARSLVSFGFAALLAVGAATAQVATSGATGIDASGSFQSEVQACMSGKTQQSHEDCMKEARNAAADKRRGVLDNDGNLQANAMARCDVHQVAEDRAACNARMMGMGAADGSVAGGGVVRSVETVVMPAGQSSITVVPQTDSEPVVLVPSTRMTQ